MLWIKRNLFLTIGGAIAIALLAVGVIYSLGAIRKNSELQEQIDQNTETLKKLYQDNPFPASTNVDAAKRELQRVQAATSRMRKYFTAPPIEKVTGLAFRTNRDYVLSSMRQLASESRTTIPNLTYAFSFEEQRTRVEFDAHTFPLVPEQMADVRAICGVLFEAHVDPLVNVRRARVSDDDEKSTHQSDYLNGRLMTNAAADAVISPYEVTFHCLSAEMSTVLQKLALSPHGLVVKAIQVEEAAAAAGGTTTPSSPGTPGGRRPAPGAATATPKAAVGADKAVTLLNERRFQVTMLIYAIRALETPKAGK